MARNFSEGASSPACEAVEVVHYIRTCFSPLLLRAHRVTHSRGSRKERPFSMCHNDVAALRLDQGGS